MEQASGGRQQPEHSLLARRQASKDRQSTVRTVELGRELEFLRIIGRWAVAVARWQHHPFERSDDITF